MAPVEAAENTTLHPVSPEMRPVVEHLWQLYRHDLSEFRGMLPEPDGLFPLRHLGSFYDDPDRAAYLLVHESRPAGFAFVKGVQQEPRSVGEFFVVRAMRRRRLGRDAALELLRRHPGLWEIAFQEENPGAARFWRGTATEAVGDSWTQERRPVPGKPHIPPDVWITLTTRRDGEVTPSAS